MSDILEETWLPLERFPSYAISTHGNIVNTDLGGRWILGNKPGRYIPRKVNLRRADGLIVNQLVHRLLMETFVVEWKPWMEVSYKDFDTGNCRLDNLEIRNYRGPLTYRVGEEQAVIRWIFCKERDRHYQTVVQAAEDTGVHRASIYKVLDGTWESVGGYSFEWVYA